MSTPKTQIERMYEVADDNEMAILDSLQERAGITWECRDEDGRSHWTNDEIDDLCNECGKPKPSGAA